jgi:hypothetical protein
VKCSRCGFSFKPATGAPITGAIVIYSVVVAVIAFILFGAILSAGRH